MPSSLISFYAIFYLYPYLFLFYMICSFSTLFFFFMCHLDVLIYISVLFDVSASFLCESVCLTKVAAFVATLSIPSKRELPASQPNTNTKTEWAKKTRCGACHSLEALMQVRASLRVQSLIFLSLMLFAPYLVHILSFREPRWDKPAATQLR